MRPKAMTLAKGKPFTFLDHAIKCGDSLLGVSQKQLQAFDLHPSEKAANHVLFLDETIKKVARLRETAAMITAGSLTDVERQQKHLAAAEHEAEKLKAAADILLSDAFSNKDERRTEQDHDIALSLYFGDLADLKERAAPFRKQLQAFHWPLEFPEVFVFQNGFDAIIGNPPFIGGQKITGLLGHPYREYLVRYLARGQRGSADYSAYFFLQARQLLRDSGCFGLLATNTIAQGDTREVGLDQLSADGVTLMRAIPSRKWPGVANLEVSHVWGRRGAWRGPCVLVDSEVAGISSALNVPGATVGNPHRLEENKGKSFQGSIVLGMGFIMEPDEAQRLIDRDPKNSEVLFPYLNGEDLNSRADQSASRWVINFRDWPLAREAKGKWIGADERKQKQWLRSGLVPSDYPDPVATDYPDCLDSVRAKVKPEREKKNRKVYRERWWHYAEKRPELYATIADLDRVLVRTQTSRTQMSAFVPNGQVYGHKLIVFVADDDLFAALDCSFHYHWVIVRGSSMRTDAVYTPSDCFATFPFPTLSVLQRFGTAFLSAREVVMRSRSLGLTDSLALFNNSDERAADIVKMRRSFVDLDHAVAAAYGWTFPLDHGFYETKQGTRFTISAEAQRRSLDFLLQLNHQRYAEEQGATESKQTTISRGKKAASKPGLFDTEVTIA
ncbi:MAG: Eco57I restriction-modification methylase domain-containing protein [Bryobacteraceae bacterium]